MAGAALVSRVGVVARASARVGWAGGGRVVGPSAGAIGIVCELRCHLEGGSSPLMSHVSFGVCTACTVAIPSGEHRFQHIARGTTGHRRTET